MYLRLIGLALFLLFSRLDAQPPPDLSPRDVKSKIGEILKAHVTYHELSPELISRAFENYLCELDPMKTYLIEGEVIRWSQPSQELLKDTLMKMKRGDYSEFLVLHEVIFAAIQRRAQIEAEIVNHPLPEGVDSAELKDAPWPKTREELVNRILAIRSLQMEAASKFDEKTVKRFEKRLVRRRATREGELNPENKKELQKQSLSMVLKSITAALDSQTHYFTPVEANQFMMQVQQKLFGIGAQLRDDLNGLTVMRLLEGGPAKEGKKLKVGDRIIAVNKDPIIGMDIIESVELIRGPKGTKVVLTIVRESDSGEETFDMTITRNEIVLEECRFDSRVEPFGDGAIGIFNLYSFYKDAVSSSADDIRKLIEKFKEKYRLKGVILDLRDNAGGLLSEAVDVTGLFIKKGVVVSIKDNAGFVQHLRNVEDTKCWDGPLAVLTNRGSASAAEIVAQTLQEYGRAVVVGDETTFGKGTFQTFTLATSNYGKVNNKGEYKVTRGRYYTVSGKSPQLVGVKADVVAPGIYSELEIGEEFAKFPLEPDQIKASFEDDLSDVPTLHRARIAKLYKFDLQPVLDTYSPILDTLKMNSAKRIEGNPNYQNFLQYMKEKSDSPENFGLNDLQEQEAVNVMKDMILLLNQKAA